MQAECSSDDFRVGGLRALPDWLLKLLWWSAIFISPILLLQSLYVRRVTPRLPQPKGPNQGQVAGNMLPLHLLLIGESTVAGIGVAEISEGLSARAGYHLARLSKRQVNWVGVGENGVRISSLLARIKKQNAKENDFAIVAVGVNDTTGLTSLRHWRNDVTTLIMVLGASDGIHVLFSAVPPMEKFTALPQPLRFLAGVRAALLDHVLREAVDQSNAHYVDVDQGLDSDHLATDGFHPSAKGCDEWALQLARKCKSIYENGRHEGALQIVSGTK